MILEETDSWNTPDGWRIRRAMLRPAGGGSRGSLLFLNGRADHIEKYTETLHDWAERGWAVESFDWRGQGGSGRMTSDPLLGHVGDFALWIDDLAAYCRQWRARTGGAHVIVAHSMGGHILLRTLAEKRVEADAAVLVAPMLGIRAGGLPHAVGRVIAWLACAIGRSRRPVWSHRLDTLTPQRPPRPELTHSEARFGQETQVRIAHPELVVEAPSWGWLRAAYRSVARLSRPGFVEQATTPLLILATRTDKLVSFPAIARMAPRLPRLRFHVYDGPVGHEILREVDAVRDDALARIDAFFDEHAPGDVVG